MAQFSVGASVLHIFMFLLEIHGRVYAAETNDCVPISQSIYAKTDPERVARSAQESILSVSSDRIGCLVNVAQCTRGH